MAIGADAHWQLCWPSRFVLIAGILASITTNVSYWNWYGFPGVYTASYILIEIVGFVLVGVAAALVLGKRGPAI